jgi:butyrate kinase
MPPAYRILAVNPGSTSTKIALYDDEGLVASIILRHDAATLSRFSSIWDQFPFRLHAVREWALARTDHASAVVGTGGLLRPLPGGTYRINRRMLEDARANLQGEHASNLGCAIADSIAREFNCHGYVTDPVSVDEFEPLARYSGHPLITRSSLSHALNLHAAAERAATELNLVPDRSSMIVAHLGGGISIAPVRGGKIIDINDASSDGPFSPERTGGLPLQQFITLCYSGPYSEQEVRTLVMGRGGLLAYLGTNSALEVEQRIREGDARAEEVYRAMAYQIAKEIGAMSTVLRGTVQAIVLTGGLASSALLIKEIESRVAFIAPVLVFPGEDEMRTLAHAALSILRGTTTAAEY